MICNIIDKRTNPYNVECDVVFEPSQHDNSIQGATKFDWGAKVFTYDDLCNTTIVRAIAYANDRWDCPVTMFIYDLDLVSSDKLR